MDEKINEIETTQVEEQKLESVEQPGNKGNGSTVLLTVIGVAAMMVALVGATFAYFTTNIKNNATQSINLTTKAPVGLDYQATNSIALEDIVPGKSETSTFTITNPASSTIKQSYDLYLVVEENNLVNTEGDNQLLVTVSDGSGIAPASEGGTLMNQPIDLTNGASTVGKKYLLANDVLINIGETQTYSVNVEFKDLNVPQDANQGKNFKAHIELADNVSVK